MSKKNISHPKRCEACGRPLRRSKVAYHSETLKAYCAHSKGCDLDQRPKPGELLTDYDPYKLAYSTPFPPDVQETTEALIPKAHSFRLTPEQVLFIQQYALDHHLANINQVVQHLIISTMAKHTSKHPLDRCPFEPVKTRQSVTKNDLLQEELDYYKQAVEKVNDPIPLPAKPKPTTKKEEKKNVAFKL